MQYICFEFNDDLLSKDFGISDNVVKMPYGNWVMLLLFAKEVDLLSFRVLRDWNWSAYYSYYRHNGDLLINGHRVEDTLIYQDGVIYNEDNLRTCIKLLEAMIEALQKETEDLPDKYGDEEGIIMKLNAEPELVDYFINEGENNFYMNDINVRILTDFKCKVLEKSLFHGIPHLVGVL